MSTYALPTYVLVGRILLAVLLSAQIVLIVLWATPTLQHHLFDVSQIDVVTQVISIGSQLWIVAQLAALAYVVQRVAADHAIRQSGPYPAVKFYTNTN